MSHWTNWLELASWLAAIAGTLFGVFMTVQASNASRMKATLDMALPFVRALAISLDRPDILAAYESESATTREALRKKARHKLVVAGLIFAIPAAGVATGLLLPRITSFPKDMRFTVGDAARQECEYAGSGGAPVAGSSRCSNHWSLGAPGQKIQAQDNLPNRAADEAGTADLDIVVTGCSGRPQVRWQLLADSEALGEGVAGSEQQEQQLDVPPGKSSLTFRAERIDDDSCSAELVVKAVVRY
ncbi:hypothetical protein ABZ639_03045 [Saccharomonospora sp. NPDC006951]